LKLDYASLVNLCERVAPFTGAWIETAYSWNERIAALNVAPFTGAWIETKEQKYIDYHPCDRRALHGRVD